MFIIALGFILGCFLGSLSLCLAVRSVTNKSFWGRSYCFKCNKRLHWYDLLPIVSYLYLKGKCRYCKSSFGVRHLIVEIVTGVLVAILFFLNLTPLSFFPGNPVYYLEFSFKIFILVTLVILFLTDIETGLLPDRITIPATVISLGYWILISFLKISLLFYGLTTSELGRYLLPPYTNYFWEHSLLILNPFKWAIASSLLIGLFFGSLIYITKGRGMGGGDLKMGIFLGLALGLPGGILSLMLSFLLGSLVGIALLIAKLKSFGQTIPFGPFLSTGAIIALFWGEKIINWYLDSGFR